MSDLFADNLCDRCLNECKAIRPIAACKSYYNPARRQFDWRCRICNKKVPHLHILCLEHATWLNLLQRNFDFLGLMSKMRDITRRYKLK